MANYLANMVLEKEVLNVLPPGLKVVSVESFGTLGWSLTGRINAVGSDGSLVRFFVKYVLKDHGKGQLEGEYHGMLELYKTVPQMVPKPHGWGKIESTIIPTYFYVCDFININDALPDPVKISKLVADLHKNSFSPTGKFGFHLPTFDGWLPQEIGWDSSWTSFFAKLLTKAWQTDFEINGHWAALDTAMELTLKDVIPRLIGVLESNGRTVKPCLIHGDLWEGNIGTDIETGNIFIFDAAAYYAHNEMEMGIWRVQHHQMKAEVYRTEYVKCFEKSDPVGEWDDRICLYGVKTKLMYSAAVPNGTQIRQQALEDLLALIKIYGRKEIERALEPPLDTKID